MPEEQVIDAPQQEQVAGDPPSGPDYVSKVYSTLKDNITGFDKDEATFRKLMTSDSAYRSKVYSTLKENIEGFAKAPDQFDSAVGVVRYKPGQPVAALSVGEKPIDTAAGLLEKVGIKTAQQAHADELAAAKERLTKTWDNITPLAEKTLHEDREKEALAKEQTMIQQVGSDATRVAGSQPAVPFPTIAPTTPQEVEQYKSDPENQKRLLYRKVGELQKEGKKKDADQLQADAYAAQSQSRATGREDQILANINGLKTGELRYSPLSERLIKPTDLGQSITDAWGKRQEDIGLYDIMNNGTPAEKIAALNKAIAPGDPDKPTHVPEGAGGFVGGEVGGLGLPGLAATAAGFIPAVGTAAAGGIMAHEQARRSAAGEAVKTYSEAKTKGATDEEALAAAEKGATVGMYTGAITGGLMGAAGAKAGKAALATPAASGMLRAAAAKAFSFLKEEAPAALTQGAIAGSGEVVKNVVAGRPAAEGVAEAGLGAIGYTYAFGALAKLGGAIPKTAEKIRQGLIKLPPEDVHAIATEQVQAGIVTPDEAKTAVQEVEAHRELDAEIPDKVVNDEVRLKLQKRMERRAELEEELKTVNKAFHPEIKEKIAKLDEEVNEVANSKEAKTEAEEPIVKEGVRVDSDWNADFSSTFDALKSLPDGEFVKMRNQLHDVGMGGIGEVAKLYHAGDRPDIVKAVDDLIGKYTQTPAVEPENVPRGTPENQPDARMLIEKGIESGKISDVYKPYAEHPEHFIDFLRDQIKGGNEPELRKEFGDELVNMAKPPTEEQPPQPAAPEEPPIEPTPPPVEEPATVRPPKSAKPAPPILDATQQAQADYAYKNSYPEFAKEHPGVSQDDYNRLRGAKYAQVRASQTSAKHEQLYENIMGATPQASGNRIPVDPIVGEKPKQISQIVSDVSKGLSQKIIYAKPGRKGGVGTYSTASTGIKIKYTGDLDTTAHEIGHGIDDKFGVLAGITPAIENELASFSRTGSTPPVGHPNPAQYTNAEGFAEWLRAYIVNPEIAKGAAPETFKLYESKVGDPARAAIDNFSRDVRTFAGASGRDMTLANVQWEPGKGEGLMKKVFGKSNDDGMFAISWVDKLAANFVNPMRAFEKAFDYAKGLKELDEVLPAEDPTILARLFLSIDRKFGEQLETGLRDGQDKIRLSSDGEVMNMKWLLGAFDNTDVKTITKEMQDATAYMIAKRTVELAAKQGRDVRLSGAGGGIYKDLEVANKTIAEFAGRPMVKEAARRYQEFADGVLKYMVEKGRLSKENYAKIKAGNEQYVAMQRIMEVSPEQEMEGFTGSGGKLGSVSQPIKAIKGSTRTISNPYTSLLDGMHKSIKEADRNEVLQAFNTMLTGDRTMHTGKVQPLAEVGQIAKTGDKNTITSFNNGKPEVWAYHPEIYKGLKGLDNDGYKLPGIATLHAKLLRSMTTKFPTFAVRNWIRDIQDRLIKSNDNSGFRDLVGDKEHWRDVARKGGLNAGYYMRDKEHYYGLMEEAMKDMSKRRSVIGSPMKLWHGYEHLLEKGETSNRVAEYRAGFRTAKAKGMDDYNAGLYGAFKSRDLMDFAVAGHYMKVINQMIPFSNAAMQGIRSSVVRIKERPAAFLGRMALYTVLPQAGLWAWNHRNKDDGDEYEDLPAYQRDMFWNVKVGDNKWLSIPKPYELGMLASGVDRGLSAALWDKKDAFEGYAGSALSTLSPIDQSSLAQFVPGVEEKTNYDFFRQKSIIPQHEDALDLSLRHTESASRIGKALQSATGWDARKWDHFVRSQFSYVGNIGLKLSDIGSGNDRDAFDITDLGTFKHSPAYNAPAVQNLMDYAKQWGLTQSRAYKEFNGMAGKYFDAPDDESKDKAAKELVLFSKSLLDDWKRANISEVKQGKAAVSKEKEAAKKAANSAPAPAKVKH